MLKFQLTRNDLALGTSINDVRRFSNLMTPLLPAYFVLWFLPYNVRFWGLTLDPTPLYPYLSLNLTSFMEAPCLDKLNRPYESATSTDKKVLGIQFFIEGHTLLKSVYLVQAILFIVWWNLGRGVSRNLFLQTNCRNRFWGFKKYRNFVDFSCDNARIIIL